MGYDSIITKFLNLNSPNKKVKPDASVESISDDNNDRGDRIDDDGVDVSSETLQISIT